MRLNQKSISLDKPDQSLLSLRLASLAALFSFRVLAGSFLMFFFALVSFSFTMVSLFKISYDFLYQYANLHLILDF